jgi:hypothetical protein
MTGHYVISQEQKDQLPNLLAEMDAHLEAGRIHSLAPSYASLENEFRCAVDGFIYNFKGLKLLVERLTR